MKVLFDTNIILDQLLDRKPFSENASQLFAAVEKDRIIGYLAATTITTIYYLIAKTNKQKEANKITHALMELFEIAPVNRLVLEQALEENFTDYEDAVIYQSALHIGADSLVTRDFKGFKFAKNIPIYTPEEMVRILAQNK